MQVVEATEGFLLSKRSFTVLEAILTSRQASEKLQCYRIRRIINSKKNNFRKTAVLKKKMNCKLKLSSKG